MSRPHQKLVEHAIAQPSIGTLVAQPPCGRLAGPAAAGGCGCRSLQKRVCSKAIMGGRYKHHSQFPNERQDQGYRFPWACFVCRKVFKKPLSEEPRRCPDCGGETVVLSRKFRTPPRDSRAEWAVVEYLVSCGFRYGSVRDAAGNRVPYPTTMSAAEAFVEAYGDQAVGDSS